MENQELFLVGLKIMETGTDIPFEERAARILEMARQNPNFGKRLPPICLPHRRRGEKVKYQNASPLPSCPPEKTLPRRSVMGPDVMDAGGQKSEVRSDLSHREHVQAFDESASGRDEIVLEDLKQSFDLSNPRVPGEWYTGFWFFKVHGIKATNSCACRLRSHPFIANNDLDIDSSQVPAAERQSALERNEWWRYRICHRLDSERLKREVAARERKEQERQEKEPELGA